MNKWMLCFALLALVGVAHADDAADWQKTIYLYASVGEFRPEQNTGQVDPANGWYADVGAGMTMNRYLSFQAGLWSGGHSAERAGILLPGQTSNDISVFSSGLIGNVILQLPLGWFRPYVGGGIGTYYTVLAMQDNGVCVSACSVTTTSGLEWGTQLLAGVDFDITPSLALTLSWQQLRLEDDFGVYSNGNIDLGGDSIGLAIKYRLH